MGCTGKTWPNGDISHWTEPSPPQSPWSPAGAGNRCRKELSKFLASLVLTQVLVEPGGLRVPERLACGLLLSLSCLRPPAMGLSGEQHPPLHLGGGSARDPSHPCACARGVSSTKGALAQSKSHCSGLNPQKNVLERADDPMLVHQDRPWWATLGCTSSQGLSQSPQQVAISHPRCGPYAAKQAGKHKEQPPFLL